jgi:hypothetical protein
MPAGRLVREPSGGGGNDFVNAARVIYCRNVSFVRVMAW